jgi:hypothetical protein
MGSQIEPVTCWPTRQTLERHFTLFEQVQAIGWDVDEKTGCWEWRGVRLRNGRARVTHKKRHFYPYRVIWEEVYGPIPRGLGACHLCGNSGCVNPDHIVPGTQSQNIRMIPVADYLRAAMQEDEEL